MEGTSLAKKPASFMRQVTQPVRDHASAMARCTDKYVAALKRAEAQYFEDVRRITDAINAQASETEQTSETAPPEATPAEQQAAS